MPLASLCLALLTAAAPPKLAATRFNTIDLGPGRGDFYAEHFADRLAEQGLDVVTPRETAAVLGLEGQRQKLGCGDEMNACIAELASALGADGVVLGDVAKIGTSYQVDLKIISGKTGKKLAMSSRLVASEAEVLQELARAAQAMVVPVYTALGRTPPDRPAVAAPAPAVAAAPPTPSGGTKRLWWIPAVVGVAGLALAGVELGAAESARQRLATQSFSLADAQATLDAGRAARTWGDVGLGVAAVGALAAVGLFAFGSDAPVTPAVTLTPGGAGLVLAGSWP